MAARTKSKPAPSGNGLRPKLFRGMNKKRLEKAKSGGSGVRLVLSKKDPMALIQFFGTPGDKNYFIEYDNHSWQDGGRWQYVPCAGEGCPLCEDEDRDINFAKYRFAAVVYNHTKKRVQVMEGGANLSELVFRRYDSRPELWLKRVFEYQRFETSPVSYGLDRADPEDAKVVSLKSMKPLDLEEYVVDQMKSYYGEDLPDTSDLEDDEDLDEDEDLDDEDLEDEDDLDEEAEEDLDEEDDDEDEDEDEEPERTYTKAQLAPLNIRSLRTIAEDLDIDHDGVSKTKLIQLIFEEAGADEAPKRTPQKSPARRGRR